MSTLEARNIVPADLPTTDCQLSILLKLKPLFDVL